jgi:hypothetical protein
LAWVGSIHFTPSGVSTGSKSGKLTAIASPSLLSNRQHVFFLFPLSSHYSRNSLPGLFCTTFSMIPK